VKDDRDDPLTNAARGRDPCGVNHDELEDGGKSCQRCAEIAAVSRPRSTERLSALLAKGNFTAYIDPDYIDDNGDLLTEPKVKP